MAIVVVKRGGETAEIIEKDLKVWEKAGYQLLGKKEDVVSPTIVRRPPKPVEPQVVTAPVEEKTQESGEVQEKKTVEEKALAEVLKESGIADNVVQVLQEHDIDTFEKVTAMSMQELIDLPLIGKATAEKIKQAVS